MAKQWTFADEKFIRDNHAKMTSQELADALNKTLGAINMKLSRMKLINPKFIKTTTDWEELRDGINFALDAAGNPAARYAKKLFGELCAKYEKRVI